jgi:hypothetical protein
MSMTGVRIDFLGGFGGTFSKGLIYRIGVLGMEPVTEYQESTQVMRITNPIIRIRKDRRRAVSRSSCSPTFN